MNWQQLDAGHTEALEVVDGRRVAQARVATAQLLRHGGVELAKATRDAFGAHPARWRMPEAAARLLAPSRPAPALTPPPVPVVMRPCVEEHAAKTPVTPAPSMTQPKPTSEAQPARNERITTLWQRWLAVCVAEGLLDDAPRETPMLRSEGEARIDLCQRIALHRGQRVTFTGIAAIERETLTFFAT